MSESKYCKYCGTVEMKWTDIAKAMEDMIDVAPNGVKPMFRQAIDEIRELREKVRVQREWPTIQTYQGYPLEELHRDAMSWRRQLRDPDVMLCPNLIRGHDPCPKCGDGPCKIVGHGVGR